MHHLHEKALTLIEALPYIQKYDDKIVVIKYGGNAMVAPKLKKAVMTDIVLLKQVGIRPVIVHGGGPEIDKEMKKAGIKPLYVNGLRVTGDQTMEIVEKVFGRLRRDLCANIRKAGGKPMGLCGSENELLVVKQKDPLLGRVGLITKTNPQVIHALIRDGLIPVVSSIGVDKEGKSYNINADTAASALAAGLKAEKLTILTNVDGVLESGRLIPHLSIRKAQAHIKAGVISKGMIPKVEACLSAVRHGVKKSHLINGTIEHSLLIEIFTDEGSGTEFVAREK